MNIRVDKLILCLFSWIYSLELLSFVCVCARMHERLCTYMCPWMWRSEAGWESSLMALPHSLRQGFSEVIVNVWMTVEERAVEISCMELNARYASDLTPLKISKYEKGNREGGDRSLNSHLGNWLLNGCFLGCGMMVLGHSYFVM